MKLSEVLVVLASRLDQLGILYMVAGSFASSVYGRVRTTYDADLVASLKLEQVDAFVDSLRKDFYVDRGQVEQALLTGRPFSVIHLKSAFKVDIFPLGDRPFDREAFSRRMKQQLVPDSPIELCAQSAEDTLLYKLEWFRLGGEVSETQWLDALGIVKRQQNRLDLDYLHRWAPEVGVARLLAHVLEEAGQTPGTA
jgi:hypothetical protein